MLDGKKESSTSIQSDFNHDDQNKFPFKNYSFYEVASLFLRLKALGRIIKYDYMEMMSFDLNFALINQI